MRRLFVSLTGGILLLVLAAGQAGAAPVDENALAVASEAATVGFEAANAIFEDAEDGSIAATPGLQKALQSVSTFFAEDAEPDLAVMGRQHAQHVLSTLLEGSDPDTLEAPGAAIAEIAEAYKALKAERAGGVGVPGPPPGVPANPAP